MSKAGTKKPRKKQQRRISVKRLAKLREDVRLISLFMFTLDRMGVEGANDIAERCWATHQNLMWLLNNNKNSFYVVF